MLTAGRQAGCRPPARRLEGAAPGGLPRSPAAVSRSAQLVYTSSPMKGKPPPNMWLTGTVLATTLRRRTVEALSGCAPAGMMVPQSALTSRLMSARHWVRGSLAHAGADKLTSTRRGCAAATRGSKRGGRDSDSNMGLDASRVANMAEPPVRRHSSALPQPSGSSYVWPAACTSRVTWAALCRSHARHARNPAHQGCGAQPAAGAGHGHAGCRGAAQRAGKWTRDPLTSAFACWKRRRHLIRGQMLS